jgi:hypothetical protein
MAFTGSIIAPYGANTAKEYATAVGSQIAGAPAQFANTLGNMYGSFNQGYGTYNQALQGLGNSYAQNYAAMAGGVGGIANALGNTWNNAQANNQASSSAEAARQAAVSNLGTAAMANYGNVAGQGLQAWAANQNGYQKSLSDMTGANQNAVSQLGVGRYNALAGLGKSGAVLGVGQSVAGAIPGLAGAFGTNPSTPAGAIPSGDAGYGMLDALRGDINNGAELSSLNNNFSAGLGSLNSDQAIARNTPRTMVNDAYGSLMNFNRMNLDESRRGMDQFYDESRQAMNRPVRPGQPIPTGSLLEALAGGYSDSAGRIDAVRGDLNSGWGDAKNTYTQSTAGVNDLFNRTIGNTGAFRNKSQMQTDQWALEDAALARRKQQEGNSRSNVIAAYGGQAAFDAYMSQLEREAKRPQLAMGAWRRA